MNGNDTAAPAAQAAAERVHVLGIRHHGPGSARSVVAELDRLTPSLVLIEGPADADPLLALAADEGMTPPVALLAYVTDNPRRSAFWPYAVFSPEWQAILWAARHDVPVRFCDLPAAAFLDPALGTDPDEDLDPGDEGADSDTAPLTEQVRTDPIAVLATVAGYDDPERWWDDVIEARLHGVAPFPAITEAMTELRTHAPAHHSPTEARQEQLREAHMRQSLRRARKDTDGTIAVICGAWHTPALTGKLPSAAADAALLRGLPRTKVAHAWVPWTHSRLAYTSGYGAGIESPGWYHHLFTAPDLTTTRWLTRVAGVLRKHDLPISSAHVIEAVRLADTLATLRGRQLAGLAEVSEATRAVMCDGDDIAADWVTRDLVIGELLGAVPEHAPAVPLERDLRARAKTLRLKLDPLEKTIDLDLRRDNDRSRSALLHQLTALGINWALETQGRTHATGTFRETWTLRWEPELSVAIIDAALWGTTVAGAAAAKLTDAGEHAEHLAAITHAVERALLADLPGIIADLLRALDAKAALDHDVTHLMTAIPPLVRAARYGDVRGTDTAALARVVDALTIRICAGLPAAITSLGDDAARDMRTGIDAVQSALTLDNAGTPTQTSNAHTDTDTGTGTTVRELWLSALLTLTGRDDIHGLIAGRATRILLESAVIDDAEATRRFSYHLSRAVPVAAKAAWAEGFLSGSGLLLVHDRALLAVLDTWLAGLDAAGFLDVLPLLRRAVAGFSSPERANIAAGVKTLRTVSSEPTAAAADIDLDRAGGVLATIAAILDGATR